MTSYEILHFALVLGGLGLLDERTRRSARKAFQLWLENPYHRSLRFKCINAEEKTWSVRITRGHRALGIREGDTVT